MYTNRFTFYLKSMNEDTRFIVALLQDLHWFLMRFLVSVEKWPVSGNSLTLWRLRSWHSGSSHSRIYQRPALQPWHKRWQNLSVHFPIQGRFALKFNHQWLGRKLSYEFGNDIHVRYLWLHYYMQHVNQNWSQTIACSTHTHLKWVKFCYITIYEVRYSNISWLTIFFPNWWNKEDTDRFCREMSRFERCLHWENWSRPQIHSKFP